MLTRQEALKIREQLDRGMTQREAARRAKCCRMTIAKIASGVWFTPTQESRAANKCYERPLFSGPHKRCKTCGGLVQMPCLACKVRKTA